MTRPSVEPQTLAKSATLSRVGVWLDRNTILVLVLCLVFVAVIPIDPAMPNVLDHPPQRILCSVVLLAIVTRLCFSVIRYTSGEEVPAADLVVWLLLIWGVFAVLRIAIGWTLFHL